MGTQRAARTRSINEGVEMVHTLLQLDNCINLNSYREQLEKQIEQARTKFFFDAEKQVKEMAQGAEGPFERFERNLKHLYHLLNFAEGFEEGIKQLKKK